VNPRIRELAEQTGYKPLSPPAFADELNEIFMRKFAELIVRECIDCVRGAGLADDVALRNKLGYNDGIAEGVVHIQKHFGVKE